MIPQTLIEALRRARHVAVLTGAGTSAESGVPTFRDAQTGLWARYRAEDLATPEAFARDPKTVWEWYAWRRMKVQEAKPNEGHLALAQFAKRFKHFDLITQNVDGLHHRAGHEQVIELHGNILRSICSQTRRRIDDEYISASAASPPPSPHAEGGLARPDVVWFGESLPEAALNDAMTAARNCQVMLVLGTSGMVQPAASLPLLALDSGALVAEINPQRTELTEVLPISIRESFAVAVPAVVTVLGGASR